MSKYNLNLADPKYHESSKIDILIGADWYYDLITDGKLKDTQTNLHLQNTVLGWVIAGVTRNNQQVASLVTHLTVLDINALLQNFWELEELPTAVTQSDEEVRCEEHFKNTYTRNPDGRFVVRLPFNENIKELGNTRQVAQRRLILMEKRLQENPAHNQEYIKFMDEYEQLDHMHKVPTASTTISYLLPHHYVLREKASTTKLRVVFDGSASPRQGLSLNQTLMVGPKQQDDLVSIVLRFRMHNVAFTADLEKMYRQVEVHRDNRKYQHILWRRHPSLEMREYELNTLTYGTAAAPFLAVRCLRQLAELEQSNYPEAAKIILNDFYVDDVITGTDTIEEALHIQQQLIKLLGLAQFNIHKWNSSHHEVLMAVPVSECNNHKLTALNSELTKTLGIHWNSKEDMFQFKIENFQHSCSSKRAILSNISKLFDPLGWLAPTIIIAKILIQRIWLTGVGWDDEVPGDIIKEWTGYVSELALIDQIKLPRKAVADSASGNCLLIGFSDASEQAYGATVYLRSTYQNEAAMHLVCSKTRVAPLKRISLPRLELCGAVLLARLLNLISKILNIKLTQQLAKTDSTIVLSWIKKTPGTWKTFVANRVAQIQELLPPSHWSHITSEQNPADCLTRGMLPSKLSTYKLWWHGPQWMCLPRDKWPQSNYNSKDDNSEARKPKPLIGLVVSELGHSLVNKYSSLTKLVRITAYCLRFANNCRQPKAKRLGMFITTKELMDAEQLWVRIAQRDVFEQERTQCSAKQPVANRVHWPH